MKFGTKVETINVGSAVARREGFDAIIDVLVWELADVAGADSCIALRFRMFGVIDRVRPSDSYARPAMSCSWFDYTEVDHVPRAAHAAARRAAAKALAAKAAA